MKTVYFHSTRHPCTENAMNLNVLKRCSEANEWVVTKDPDQADVIVVSTCGFSLEQEEYELETIRKMGLRKKPGCELIVAGCLPEISKEKLQAVFNGPTVPTDDISRFDQLMGFEKSVAEFDNHHVSEAEYDADPRIHRFFRARRLCEKLGQWLPGIRVPRVLWTVPSEKWWCVRCAMGCTGNCSYCGIRHAHGKLRSEPMDKLVEEVMSGVRRGYREIALTGEDLGGWGVDIGSSLAELLDRLMCQPGNFAINLRFVDPYWLCRLKPRLHAAFRTGRIRAFCAPAQSGSNRILKAMNRRYTFELVKDTVNWAVRTGVGMISNNIIVGFPGETEEDLEQSLRLIHEVDYGMHMVFRYEDRPGTKASQLPDKIPAAEIERRYAIVHREVLRAHRKRLFGF